MRPFNGENAKKITRFFFRTTTLHENNSTACIIKRLYRFTYARAVCRPRVSYLAHLTPATLARERMSQQSACAYTARNLTRVRRSYRSRNPSAQTTRRLARHDARARIQSAHERTLGNTTATKRIPYELSDGLDRI